MPAGPGPYVQRPPTTQAAGTTTWNPSAYPSTTAVPKPTGTDANGSQYAPTVALYNRGGAPAYAVPMQPNRTAQFINECEGTNGAAVPLNVFGTTGSDGADVTVTYDTSVAPASGTSSIKFTTSAGANTGIRIFDLPAHSSGMMSFYYRHDAAPLTNTNVLARVDNFEDPGNPTGGQIRIVSSTGKFRISDAATVAATSTLTPSLNTDYRLDWYFDALGKTQRLEIFTGANLHGTTPDETLTGAFATVNPTTSLSRVRCGMTVAPGNAMSLWIDSVWYDTSGVILPRGSGSTAASASGSITLSGTAAADAPVTASGSITLDGSAVATLDASAAGSITLGGTGTGSVPASATGSLTLGGTAAWSITSGVTGSLTLGGTATAAATAAAAGSVTLGGTVTGQAAATAAGSLTLGGSAAWSVTSGITGSITLAGTATARGAAAATGSITLGGTTTAVAAAAATGSITLSGTARAETWSIAQYIWNGDYAIDPAPQENTPGDEIYGYYGSPLTWDQADGHSGTTSLSTTTNSAVNPQGLIHFAPAGVLLAAGTQIVGGVWAKVPNGTTVRIGYRWNDSVGGYGGETVANYAGTGAWTYYQLPVWTGPAQTFRPGLEMLLLTPASGVTLKWDDLLLSGLLPAASITLGGTVNARAAVTATGSLTLGGTATAQGAATASGSVTLGGTATVTPPGTTATGSITLAGTAAWQAYLASPTSLFTDGFESGVSNFAVNFNPGGLTVSITQDSTTFVEGANSMKVTYSTGTGVDQVNVSTVSTFAVAPTDGYISLGAWVKSNRTMSFNVGIDMLTTGGGAYLYTPPGNQTFNLVAGQWQYCRNIATLASSLYPTVGAARISLHYNPVAGDVVNFDVVSLAKFLPAVTGSLTLGGTVTGQAPVTASGSLALSGTAAWQVPAGSVTGSLTLGGTATARGAATAAGSLTLGGSATAAAPATASGSIALAGTATARGAATASGSITLAGTATGTGGGGSAASASGALSLAMLASWIIRAAAPANLMPPWQFWTLSGGAYIDGEDLVLPSNGAQALSPLIDVRGYVGNDWMFSTETKASAPSPNVPFQPLGGRLYQSFYAQADGVTPATNSLGYTSNGNAAAVPIGTWGDRYLDGGYWGANALGGGNVAFVQMKVLNSNAWTSGEIRHRRPMFTYSLTQTPYVPYFPIQGALTLTGYIAAVAAVMASGSISLGALQPVLRWVFTPPTTGQRYERQRKYQADKVFRHAGTAPRHATVIIKDGQVTVASKPPSDVLQAADAIFEGAADYHVTETERAILQAAGYGQPWLRQVVEAP